METNQPSQQIPTVQTPPPNEPLVPAQTSEPGGIFKHISGRTIVLILVLAAFTGFFLFLALTPPKQNTITKVQPTPTPNVANSVLVLDEVVSSQAGTAKNIAVDIDTGINKVTAVQIALSFNPQSVGNITITPGSFISQPVELIKTIDYANGRITYALGIPPTAHGIQGKGTVATINFQPLASATEAATMFSFMPKTVVTAEGITPSVLKNSVGITVPLRVSASLQPSTATPSSR